MKVDDDTLRSGAVRAYPWGISTLRGSEPRNLDAQPINASYEFPWSPLVG